MIQLSKIIKELEVLAPSSLKFPWDNVGLLVGDENQKISRVFVCLDITHENVRSAIAFGADLIVSHHPLIFDPLKSITESTLTGGIVRALIQNNISAFCMHTSFDMADGGMNDILAQKLGLSDIRKFTPDECIGENGEVMPENLTWVYVETSEGGLYVYEMTNSVGGIIPAAYSVADEKLVLLTAENASMLFEKIN